MDCSALECMPRSQAAAAASLSSKKRKGNFGIIGLMGNLGQVHSKLDRVLAGLASKPNRRRKRSGFLGLAKTAFGHDSGSVHDVGSGQISDLGLDMGLVLGTDPGSDPVLGFSSKSIFVESDSIFASTSMIPPMLPLVFEANVETLARSPSGLRAVSKSVSFFGLGSQLEAV